ncbi:MAG: hypothetical protein HWQ43_13160 [Nostoc sp. JL31]|uniref:hypothetical protein n=1 Tax=Nostoc sp. JL31 TaxID=2815395 RepID=UPI0025F6E16C|nr:hypothetical protein [Nostoc sp. JL31]MBN3890071.1 hypothetical protein [Nostoc sp. JL31]
MLRTLEDKFNRKSELFLLSEDEYQPKNKLEEIAVKAVKLAGLHTRLGDYEFVSTAVRLLEPFIAAWYHRAELSPPSTATICKWFYSEPPIRRSPYW